MSRYEPSVTLSQQGGGMSVQAFAEQQGITLSSMRKYLKAGRIVGARQDSRSKKWMIYPPAKLVDKSGDAMRRREELPHGLKQAHQPLAAALAVPLGTSPHGLSVELVVLHQETPEALSLRLLAKPVLTLKGWTL